MTIITAQLIDLGWQVDLVSARAHDTASATARAHYRADELRDAHGRWAREAAEDSRVGNALRSAYSLPGQGRVKNQAELQEAATKEAVNSASYMPQLLGGGAHENAWNGTVNVYSSASKPGVLAELDWDGNMNVADNVAQALQTDQTSKPGSLVKYPDAHEVILHELIHGVVPSQHSRAADEKAYQDYAQAQIEEGFTELGAIHHAPEFFRLSGLADRPTDVEKSGFAEWGADGKPVKHYYTVGEEADNIADPVNIAEGNTWGHYTHQTKDAQDWVQQIALEEGYGDLRPGTPGHTRVVQLADQINRQGTSEKVEAMAVQMALATVKDPKLRDSTDFMASVTGQVEQSIKTEWAKGEPDAAKQAFAAARHSVQVRSVQALREMAEQAAAA